MKPWCLLAIVAIFTLSVIAVDDADARRFGGGASFGKQRMHAPAPPHVSQQRSAPGKPASQRGSARTGMMGMLGGLALGGLLGAMFFGGAFEGINLFDIVVLGALAALLIWFLRRKAGPGLAGAHAASFGQDTRPASGRVLRPDIREKEFLKAAREIFMRMQAAWDARDMDEIRRFCTPEVAAHIENEMRQRDGDRTEVAALDARIADSWIENHLEWVAVDFTAMLREQTLDAGGRPVDDRSSEVHETWIFRHDPNADDPTWYLAGIQQA